MTAQPTLTLDHSLHTSLPTQPSQQLSSTPPAVQQQAVEDKTPPQHITLEFVKDGRLAYTEPKLLAENHPHVHQRIAAFRLQRQQFEAAQAASPPSHVEFPADFSDLVVALTQDSDETLPQMTQRINDLLSPFQRNEQFTELFSDAIERSIKACASRTKYGLLPRVLAHLETGPATIPHQFSLYRWESNEVTCLPEDMQNYIHHRRNSRLQMSEALTKSFEALTPEQQLVVLHTKARKMQAVEETKSREEIELEKERRRKKEEEKRAREEEKRKREEEKRLREEDRKKKEEDRKRREEEKKKKEQSQLRLTSLFTKAPEDKSGFSGQVGTELPKANPSMFPPFYVKEHVSIYPWTRAGPISPNFDLQLRAYETNPNEPVAVSKDLRSRFLQELKSKGPETTQKRGIHQSIDLRSVLLGPNPHISEDLFSRNAIRMKLLQFTEDVRPAYYGTWTKKSSKISGRHPLGKDEDIVDYEHDSEAEWEPEGEGEEIQSGDEEEDDPMGDVADPDDAGWLVPEGYLSEGEGVESDDESSGRVISRPVVRPAKKYTSIRPVAIGPIFDDDDDDNDADGEEDTMKMYAIKMLGDASVPYDPMFVEPKSSTDNTTSATGNENDQIKKINAFTSEQATELINIIEGGKTEAMPKLISEAKANKLLQNVPKRQIEMKIKDLAIKEKRGADTKPSWYVKKEDTA